MDYYSYWNPPFAAIKGHVSLLNSKHNYKEKKKTTWHASVLRFKNT